MIPRSTSPAAGAGISASQTASKSPAGTGPVATAQQSANTSPNPGATGSNAGRTSTGPASESAPGGRPADTAAGKAERAAAGAEAHAGQAGANVAAGTGAQAGANSAGVAHRPGATQQGETESGTSTSAANAGAISPGVQAALEKAGVKLQQAGTAVATAQTPEELAKAKQLLAQARILVIVGSQDLQDAQQKPGGTTAGEAKALGDAQKSLDNATIALVVANNVLLGRPGIEKLPPVTGIATSGNGSDKVRKLDKKLDHTLVVYDGRLEKARSAVEQPGSPAMVADQGNAPHAGADSGTAASTGGIAGIKLPPTTAPIGGMQGSSNGISSGTNSIGGANTGKPQSNQAPMPVPEGVGSGQDDDIVAKQLREAATAETDPKLRKKLWDEYKRYKSGL